ncbi:sigma-70 family RNA polymerase sigma factor [Sphingosinicella sp.]|uniref:RNA polymerase sigma factor n=1 Tax=Sphingosinicella sp. TaxID=1917971 RepID=UPI0025D72F43|nr:sigma-70 family RNA polymerase sigma factor [Sphingosinicella sp.]
MILLAAKICLVFLLAMHSSDARAHWLAKYVLPHEPALRAWLLRRRVDGLEIDDVVQETYARLSTVGSVDGIVDHRSYIVRTAHSVMMTHLRRARVVPMQSFAQMDTDIFVDEEPDPETVAGDRDELHRLGAAIATLPSRMREVFVLRRIEGLSQRQVAERLGVTESTVEKQMANGFRRLARVFGRCGRQGRDASREETREVERAHAKGDKSGD